MNRRRLTTLAAVLAATLAGFGTAAQAQGDKPIRILVGFPPGGSIDIVARLLADKLKDELKTSVIVENRAGAGGRIAAELLKSAPADGSTFMITPVVVPVLAPMVFSKLNYNAATDFSPVGHVCNFGFAVTVPTALPVKNVAELVTWLKANPQKANFGSPAAGSLPHFFGEMLGTGASLDLVHVPFNGSAQLISALVGGQIIGEHVGVVMANGGINTDCAPINPITGQPYFTLPAIGWGAGWAAGNVLRMNTVGAMFTYNVIRTVQAGPEAGQDYAFSLLTRGDVDRP